MCAETDDSIGSVSWADLDSSTTPIRGSVDLDCSQRQPSALDLPAFIGQP